MFLGGKPGLVVMVHPVLGKQVFFGIKSGKEMGDVDGMVQGLRESWVAFVRRLVGRVVGKSGTRLERRERR